MAENVENKWIKNLHQVSVKIKAGIDKIGFTTERIKWHKVRYYILVKV